MELILAKPYSQEISKVYQVPMELLLAAEQILATS